MSGGGNPYVAKAKLQLKEESKEIKARIVAFEKQVADVRYQMAQRETELLLVFRELMQCDIFAPDNYFDGDRLLKQSRYEQLGGAGEEFLVPLSTFWRPVETGDHVVDPNSKEGREKYTVRGLDALNNPATRGRFLADGLQAMARDRRESRSGSRGKSPKGPSQNTHGYSLLRDAAPEKFVGKDYIAFPKLTNPSFAREQEDLHQLSTKLRA